MHSIWRPMIDDQYLIASRGLSAPAFLAPHPLDVTSSQGNISL
jgi:hypothetical protein